jgi:hypothetical protein
MEPIYVTVYGKISGDLEYMTEGWTHMTIREKDLHGRRVWCIQYTVYTMRMVRKAKAKTIDPGRAGQLRSLIYYHTSESRDPLLAFYSAPLGCLQGFVDMLRFTRPLGEYRE